MGRFSSEYRVVVTEYNDNDGETHTWFEIKEVYLIGDEIQLSKGSITIEGNNKKDLKWKLKQMHKAFSEPILWGDDRFPLKYEKDGRN